MIDSILLFVGGVVFGVAGGILLFDYVLLNSWRR